MRKTWAAARWPRAAALALFACGAQQAVAVNKCTGKDGAVIYQDAACNSSHTSAQPIKTWSNSPGASGGIRTVEPDAKLAGPPQAAQLLQIYRRWIDAEKLALNTSRVALAVPVANMQALNREVEGLAVPACMSDARRALQDITSKSASTLLNFMGDRNDIGGMVYQLLDRSKLVSNFEQSVNAARCV